MKVDVSNKRIDEDDFMKMREDVLSTWPTGKEVDLDEAIEYQRNLPDTKNFCKVTQRLRKEGKTVVFPRAGQSMIEDEIELNKTLVEAGLPLIPVTTDSYTRLMQFEKVQQALDESAKTGTPMLNGYPIINHGVKNTRKVVEACDAAYNLRLGGVDAQRDSVRKSDSHLALPHCPPVYFNYSEIIIKKRRSQNV